MIEVRSPLTADGSSSLGRDLRDDVMRDHVDLFADRTPVNGGITPSPLWTCRSTFARFSATADFCRFGPTWPPAPFGPWHDSQLSLNSFAPLAA